MDGELVSIASDITIGVSALVVAIVAFCGLRTWRRELTGKAKFEVARNVMSSSLRLRDQFKWARFPITSSAESVGRSRQEDENAEVSRVLDIWYASLVSRKLLYNGQPCRG